MFNINIPDNIKFVMNRLCECGYESYIVGGCVRDALMGIAPNDFDITTNALPQEIIACFSECKIVETGIKHGTVAIILDQEKIEITTYRIDGDYVDNRHPEQVYFTKDIQVDLSRRDFTVNSMAYNEREGVLDLFGGQEDIINKVISCVGDADIRFGEDGLRILRALRFASVLGFSVEEKTAKSIHRNKNLLKNISIERIYAEFVKILCGENVEKILTEYSDVICVFIPEIGETIGFDQKTPYHCYDVYTHIIKVVAASENDKYSRLAALFHDIAKPRAFSVDETGRGHFYNHPTISAEMASLILQRLKAERITILNVCELIRYHDEEIIPIEKSVKKLLCRMSYEQAIRLMLLKLADMSAQAPEHQGRKSKAYEVIEIMKKLNESGSCIKLKDLAVSGDDLIESGFLKGPVVGEILNILLDLVVDEIIPNEKNSLLEFAKKYRKDD